eukprot:129371-Rhodomonas_salina.1
MHARLARLAAKHVTGEDGHAPYMAAEAEHARPFTGGRSSLDLLREMPLDLPREMLDLLREMPSTMRRPPRY